MINSTVTRMSDLIDNILDFARGRLGGGITLHRDAAAAGAGARAGRRRIANGVSSAPDRDQL